MSFCLHQSNCLDKLAEQLTMTLANAQFCDPFSEDIVIVPDRGMARWLSLKIASDRGLCPAIDFPYPGAFLYRYIFNPMVAAERPHLPGDNGIPFAPDAVQWRILKCLTDLESQPPFARVRHFVEGDPVRRFQLAAKISQLFDRYMTYRPDVLGAWEQGKEPLGGEDADWQARLWRSLLEADQSYPRHFSGLYLRYLQALSEQITPQFLDKLLAKRRVFCFGISSLPPAHLDILTKLGDITDFSVHVFALNPCKEYWFDANSLKVQMRDKVALMSSLGTELASNYMEHSNPLLGSLGKSGREFFSLLLAYDTIEASYVFTEPAPPIHNTFSRIKNDIFSNVEPAKTQPFDTSDHSLSIHSCHSPMREVEVLRDQLLALFKEYPNLTPRDVNILTPDVQTYAPYIDAVFGSVSYGDIGFIPYVIAEKSLLHEYAECKAFIALLNVGTSRFKASEVLGLLESEPIRTHFHLTEDDVVPLTRLLSQAHLAWGLDAEFREEQGASRSYANTWKFVLDRLILGAAMWTIPDGATPLKLNDDKCVPCPAADGQESLIGCLADFIDALRFLNEKCAAPARRTCAEWHETLSVVLTRFFTQDTNAPYGVVVLRQTLAQFRLYVENGDCLDMSIPFAVVVSWLQGHLCGTPGSERFMTGKMTFSRFQPMRNVPSRVVCMLGMNDGAFPRNTPPLSFDLMDAHSHRRIGDRQTRDEDRYAFLEALLAAKERVIITYTGQSVKDNKALPPSVLVSELLDTVDASLIFPKNTSASSALTIRHPLHPFSPDYFAPKSAGNGLVSFSRVYFDVAQQLNGDIPLTPSQTNNATPRQPVASTTTNQDVLPAAVQLEDLIRFYASPCKHFFNQRLGIYLENQAQESPSDDEPFDLDALAQYLYKDTLLHDATLDSQFLAQRCEASGEVPIHSESLFEEMKSEAATLLETKQALDLDQPNAASSLVIPLSDVSLLVTLSNCYPNNRQLFMRPATEKGKDILRAGFYHLAICATDSAATTYGIYKEGRTVTYTTVPAEAAKSTLLNLIRLMRGSAEQPLCFSPDVGWALVSDPSHKTAREKWQGTYMTSPTADIYTYRHFGQNFPQEGSDALTELCNSSRTVFETLKGVRQ